MKNTVLPIILAFALAPLLASAQIKFEQTAHDFGSIKEGDMPEHTFTFVNIGKTPVSLTNVKASCGCTTPHWTKDPVAPGEKGAVRAVYNSNNRPGKFNKSITVEYGEAQSSAPVVLRISGDVISRDGSQPNAQLQPEQDNISAQNAQPVKPAKTVTLDLNEYKNGKLKGSAANARPVPGNTGQIAKAPPLPGGSSSAGASSGSTQYKDKLGNLAVETARLNIGSVTSEDRKSTKLAVKNEGAKPMTFQSDVQSHPSLSLVLDQKVLQPNEEGSLTIVFNGEKAKEHGMPSAFSERFIFKVNEGKSVETKEIRVSGVYEAKMTDEELANAPNIKFDEEEFNAEEIIEGQVLKHKYYFANTGKTDLKIQSVKASCGCTATKPDAEVIKPGERSFITAEFNSRGRSGKQHKSITVITNDPDDSRKVLHLRTTVKPDPFKQGGTPAEGGGLPTNQPAAPGGY